MAAPSAIGPVARKAISSLRQAERAAVLGMGDLGRPVEPLFPEEEDMGEFQPLGAVDRGQFHPVGVLPFGDGDEVRHLQQIVKEGSGIAGIGPLEVTLRLVPERLGEDAREKGRELAECRGEGREAVRPGRVAYGRGQPRDGGRKRLAVAQG